MAKKSVCYHLFKLYLIFNIRKIKGLKMFKYLFLVISFISISFCSSAETIEIDMVNKLGKEKMVYSIKVAKIDIGDTIIWKSVDKGHNVEFVEMPKGVKKFKSKISKDAEYKFEIPGSFIHLYTTQSYGNDRFGSGWR